MAVPKIQPDLMDDLRKLIKDPEAWLERENDQLGGQTPKELIDKGQEQEVRNLIEAVKHGMPT